MAELRSKGYFINADGVKSTNLVYKAPKSPKKKVQPKDKNHMEVDK